MPPTVKPFLLRGFKGRNGGPAENIEDAQFQELDNWFIRDGIAYPRAGLTRVSGLPFTEKLTGLFTYFPTFSTYKILFGAKSNICVLTGDQITALPSTSSSSITSSARLWHGKQYKNIMYLLRPDMGVLLRSDGTQINDSGIAAPSVAPTGVDGGAGVLAAGTYTFVYTFYNSVTGAESDYSPEGTVTLGASKMIDYSAIAVSANAQVNARKIYRSLVGQSGEYFHVGTILDNVTTVFVDEDLTIDEMGLTAENVNGIPPTGLTNIEVHQERLWMTDGSFLYFSELGLPESVRATSALDINADDGFLVKGLASFGEILLVMKQNAIYYVAGSDEQSFTKRTLHDKHGCASPHSVAIAENICFWFGGDNFYLTDGSRVAAIGSTEVQDIVDSIDPADYELIQGETYPKEGWYIAGIPANGVITKWIGYNYRSGDWHTMTFASSKTPTFIESVPSDGNEPVLYCALENADGHFYEFMEGTADAGTAISYSLRTKNYGFDREDMMKFMKEIQLLISTTLVAEAVTVTLYRDDVVAAQMTDSFTTFGGKMWKRIPLANNGAPGNFLSLAVSYSGESNFQLMGIGFKVVDLGRQSPVL